MVTSAGSELFTGNNLVMSVGGFTKSVSWGKVVKYWVICWIGNLVGSVLFAAIFTLTGIPEAAISARSLPAPQPAKWQAHP